MTTIDAAEPQAASQSSGSSLPKPRARPFARQLMQFVRRTHLYVGLLLFPWAILYGVTGFLFNHPTILADAPTTHFTRADVIGTPLEKTPSPHDQALAVVAALNEMQKPTRPYELAAGEAHYATRESFIATVKADKRTFFVVFEPNSSSGTIRETTPPTAAESAPFATGAGDAPRQRGMGMMGPMKHNHAGVKIDGSIVDVIKSGVPSLMERKGFPRGEVAVTTAPDVKFPMQADGALWTAIYNPITTNVSGSIGPPRSDLSLRSFLLRLHLSRGYPGEVTTKWFWAIGVDAIAIILCFWGISGLFMWWQIKSTRTLGLIALTLGLLTALLLGLGMHAVLAA